MQLWLTATIWYTSCLTCSPQLLRCLKSAIAEQPSLSCCQVRHCGAALISTRCLKSAIAEQPSLSCCQVRHCGAALISTRCLKSATSGAALKSQSRFFPVLSPVHADSAAVLEIFTYAVSVHATTSKCSSPHNFCHGPIISRNFIFSLAMHFSSQFHFFTASCEGGVSEIGSHSVGVGAIRAVCVHIFVSFSHHNRTLYSILASSGPSRVEECQK
jgi:hypothetical protein